MIELPALAFKGKAWQDVRTALNRAASAGHHPPPGPPRRASRAGSRCRCGRSPSSGRGQGPARDGVHPRRRRRGPRSRTCASGWRSTPTARSTASRPGCRAYSTDGGSPAGWTLDVMRRLPDGFRSSMEFLIASACLAFQDEGAAFVSLSGVPLAEGRSERLRRRPGTARRVPRPARREPRALLRLPVPAGVQVEVPAAPRAAVPRLPRRGRAAQDRRRARPGLPAGRRAARPADLGPPPVGHQKGGVLMDMSAWSAPVDPGAAGPQRSG